MVKKGDVILRLENRALFEQILASENNLALKQNDLRSTKLTFDSREVNGRKDLVTAQYDLRRLERAYQQNKSLYEDELISQEEYLKAKEEFELSQNQYDIVKLQTEQDKELRQTSLKELDREIRSIVADAAEFAQQSPEPEPKELYSDVYVSA